MLIPRCILSCLCRPLANFLCSFLVICKKTSSAATRDYLVTVKRKYIIITECTCLPAFICSAQRFRRILNQDGIMFLYYFLKLFYFSRRSVQMCNYHYFYIRIYLKCFFQCLRIHIPGIIFTVYKYRFSAFIHHRIYRCRKCHIRAEHFFTFKYICSGFRHTVHFYSCRLYRQMK